MKIQIERANLEDAAEILALQKLAYLSEARIYDDFTIPPLLQTLEETVAEFDTQVFLNGCSRAEIRLSELNQVDTSLFTKICRHVNKHII